MHRNIFKIFFATSFVFLLIFVKSSFSSCSGGEFGSNEKLDKGKPVSLSATTSDATGSSSEEEDELGRVSTGSNDSHEEKILNVSDLQEILDLTKEFNIQDLNRPPRSRDEFMAYQNQSELALNTLFQETPIATLRTWPWKNVIQRVKDKIPHELLIPIPGSVPYLLECRSHDALRQDRYEDEEFLRQLSAFFNYGPAQLAVWEEMWYSKKDHTPEEMGVINFWDALAKEKGFPETQE